MDESFPFFAPAAGVTGTTALSKNSSTIEAWATGYSNYNRGGEVDPQWRMPDEALGPAEGTSMNIVTLGRGGSITLTFDNPIRNGGGFDFAVFENSFSYAFLELAFVEVSTDGTHFTRFPNYSFTEQPVGSFGTVDPTYIYGYAGKYQQGFGTPFDLGQLSLAYDAAVSDSDGRIEDFSNAYKTSLLNNFPHLDLDEINYVRVVDIVGSGSTASSLGTPIYDPYATTGSAGFDLDAVAVLNEAEPSTLPQAIDFPVIENQLLSVGSVGLGATASSGLDVEYSILSGAARFESGSIVFEDVGEVRVEASQAGNSSYDPADAVIREFYVVDSFADQHVFFEPIANQTVNSSGVSLHSISSSGLPVSFSIVSGPSGVSMSGESSFDVGSVTGAVTIEASQSGGYVDGVYYNAATDISMSFDVVDTSDPDAGVSFSSWQVAHSLVGSESTDSDGDGLSDLEEYLLGRDPTLGEAGGAFEFDLNENEAVFLLTVSRTASARIRLFESASPSSSAVWSEVVPLIASIQDNPLADPPTQTLRLTVPASELEGFWRFEFSAN